MRPASPILVSTEDAATALGVRKTKLFELINEQELETVLLGRRRMIVFESISAYVDRLRAAAKTQEAA
jgi:excisionase family DNA binding protein